MTASSSVAMLVAFLLVFVRVGAFLLLAPPFNSRSMPTRIRVGLAFALTLPVFGTLVGQVPASPDLMGIVSLVLYQALCGLTLGFITLLLFAAIQAAGELIDLFSMFAMASMLDPFSNTNSSLFGRIQYLIGTTLLFASGGHLLLIRGLLQSFDLVPVGRPDFGALARMLTHDIGQMALAAVQIAGPVLACLFLADLALGLVSRAVPSLNVFQLSFPVKTILTVSIAAIAVSLLPLAVSNATESILAQFQPAMTFLKG